MSILRLLVAFLVIGLFAAGPVPPVSAQEKEPAPSHLAAAKEMLRVSRADQMMGQIVALMVPQQIQSVKALRPDISDKVLNRYVELFKAAISRHMVDFLDAAAQTYARHLNEADMSAAVAFFKTEAGQRLLDAQPAMLQELSQLGSAMGRQIGNKAAQEAVEQLRKEGHEL